MQTLETIIQVILKMIFMNVMSANRHFQTCTFSLRTRIPTALRTASSCCLEQLLSGFDILIIQMCDTAKN